MKNIRPSTKFSALLFLVLTLHTLALSLVLPRYEVVSFEKETICTASLVADEAYAQTCAGDCKPPKNSFIDYSTFFAPACLVPAYHPKVSKLVIHEPSAPRLQVYLEILVPPDNLA